MKPALLLLSLSAAASLTHAEDWSQWRGAKRDGISAEKGWSTEWTGDGPAQVWTAEVGIGFSAMAVASGKLYTLGWADDKDTVFCLDATTGKEVWQHSYDAELGDKYFEGGPLSTPTVDGDKVYTLGKWGMVCAFDAASGKVLWSKNLAEEVGASAPEWGFSGSILALGDTLVLNVGSHGTALEKATGKVIWKSGPESAGYSTPLPIKSGGKDLLAYSNTDSYYAVEPATGKVAWTLEWPTRYGVNACDVVPVAENQFFISSGYGKGCGLIDTSAEGAPKLLWQNKDLSCQMNPPVLIEGHLYGIDGDEGRSPTLRCIEATTGKVKWKNPSNASGALMAADGKLIAINGKGELTIAKATAEGFEPITSAQVASGRTWTVPTLVNGMLYIRNAAGSLTCFKLSK
jgi:outer membrane protein assembly factor BamB